MKFKIGGNKLGQTLFLSFFACFLMESSSIRFSELKYAIKLKDLPIFKGLGAKLELGGKI